ncbi:hypothetical protein OIU84_020460 [Salix udensis]|uniref:PGG domain-containing protein n=1 Tax=Salix udensis TaxID=889485 RepID=A0AAD6KTU8_9ROSI|nr:hypothetical protein OIU84_020460 [Salix udensis]KAJ6428806.1 hypothetical protein OIU84_020460 [Salix udensis]KAJ6428807.1 hypothetical protein OIU84_020460 [Salix udensis]
MTTGDDNLRNLFMSSIAYRHEKMFSLLYGLETGRALFVPVIDSSHNTMLHLAANLSPPSQLARISGAALQMQRELQWYKEVESIINPTDKDFPNVKGQIARELFTCEHKDLLVKGEEWMKGSATSCTVVGALIITFMFTVAFTVPGGNVQETGYLIFKDEKSFVVFIVADAISLFFINISVDVFRNSYVPIRRGRFPQILAHQVNLRPFHAFLVHCSHDGNLLRCSHNYAEWGIGNCNSSYAAG